MSAEYPDTAEPALEKIDLEVRENEFIGITGRTGSGKSTLCYCINGLIPHTIKGVKKGAVVTAGIHPNEAPPEELAPKVGIIRHEKIIS